MNRPIGKTRFSENTHQLMDALNVSIDFDRRLYQHDIAGSRAHAKMLAATGIISVADQDALRAGLDKIEEDIKSGTFTFSRDLEDIHMNVEAALADHLGADIAGRLHTARSRNDQVALDLRLYVRARLDEIDQRLAQMQKTLAEQARDHAETIMPGFTHLQAGQAVVFGHHCLAYVEMLARDRARLKDARARLNESPLGAAALAGTSFPINRDMVAQELGFDRVAANSLDAVSDRDFVIEVLAALSLCAIHLSRLGEEIILWVSPGFDFVRLKDEFSTGSSIMPQKRNPDAAELVRAKSGRVIGALVDMIVVMKGLPLAYAKDMQQDKEAIFLALDEVELCVAAMTALIAGWEVNPAAMRQMAEKGYPTATDLADWLVREKNIPFRKAHLISAQLVALAERQNAALEDLSVEDMQKISPLIDGDAKKILSVDLSVRSKTSFGGTAPDNVRAAAQGWLKKLSCLGFFGIIFVISAACGRVGALTKPPDYVPPPPVQGEVQSGTKDRLGSVLDRIKAPPEKTEEEAKKEKEQERSQKE